MALTGKSPSTGEYGYEMFLSSLVTLAYINLKMC